MSVIRFPQRNLAPESNAWARTVEKNLQANTQTLTEYRQALQRATAELNATASAASAQRQQIIQIERENQIALGEAANAASAAQGAVIWEGHDPYFDVESNTQGEPTAGVNVPENPNAVWYVLGDDGLVGETWNWDEDTALWVKWVFGETAIDPEFVEKMDTAVSEAEAAKQSAQNAYDTAMGAVTGSQVEYALSTSRTTAPTSDWTTSTVVPSASQVVWVRTKITKADGSSTVTAPALLTGPEGQPGLGVESLTQYFASFSTEWAGEEGASESILKMGGVEVARNYSLKSRGMQDWYTNNSTTNPIQANQPVPAPHPLGIETANKQTSTGTNSNLGTVYNIDGTRLAWDGVTPSLYRGAWVYVNTSGYKACVSSGTGPWHPVPANTWTFVRSDDAKSSATLYVATADSSNVSPNDAVWMTGSIASDQPLPYFDGSTQPYPELVEEFLPPVPVVDVNEPTRQVEARDNGTYIFVGRFAEPDKAQDQDILGLYGQTVYLTSDGHLQRPPTGPIINNSPYTTDGQWLAVSNYGVPYHGLGVLNLLADAWQGPMRALIFGSKLPDWEISKIYSYLMDGGYLEPPGSPIPTWSSQPPPYDGNAVLYETLLVVYDNGQYAYTPPVINTDWQAATIAMQTADGKSTITYDTNAPTNPKEGDRWYNAGTGKAQIWSGTAWRNTEPGEGFVPALDIGRGTAGDLEVGRLKATTSTFSTAVIDTLISQQAFIDSLATERLIVTPGQLLLDTSFNPSAWNSDTGTAALAMSTEKSPSGGPVAILPAGTALRLHAYYGNQEQWRIPCSGGEQIVLSMWVKASVVIPANSLGFGVQSWDASQTRTADTISFSNAQIPADTWTRIQVGYTLPSTARAFGTYMQVGAAMTGQVLIGDPRIERKIGGVLIENGALDAFQITSPLIQSVSTANRGIKWDGATLIGYTSTGAEAFKLDGTRAIISAGTVNGSTINGSTINGGVITQSIPGSPNKLTIETRSGVNSQNPGVFLDAPTGTAGGVKLGTFVSMEVFEGVPMLRAITQSAVSSGVSVTVSSNGIVLGDNSPTYGNFRAAISSTKLIVDYNDYVYGPTSFSGEALLADVVRTPRQGNWAAGSITYATVTTGVYTATKTFTLPYAVPLGYRLLVYTFESSGYTFCDLGSVSGTTVVVRVLQVGSNSSTALSRVGWAMIPTPL